MITFTNGMDIRCRQPLTPTVAKFYTPKLAYAVIGTEYSYLHTSAGDVRTWKSYSGARKAAKAYQPL